MSRRKTPTQARSAQTVERILVAAAHVFAERGYGATTNHIAEAAGVSIGSLYQYFGAKDDILEAQYARHLVSVRRRLVGQGPVEGGDAWVRWFVAALIDANRQPEAELLWETSRVLPGMRQMMTALIDDLVTDAAAALGLRSRLKARAVVVTALATVHEIALPSPTPARRRIAVDAVLAVSGSRVTTTGR